MKFKTKLAALALGVCMFGSTADAGKINTILDTNAGVFSNTEKAYEQVDNTVKELFFPGSTSGEKPSFKERMASKASTGNHTLVPISETDGMVQVYREEKGLTMANNAPVVVGQTDLSMTKDDMMKLSDQFGSDYILYFRITNSFPTVSVGFMTGGQKVSVTTDFRVFDKKVGNYVFVKRYQTTGSSSSFYVGAGSTSNAIQDGVDKALKQIRADRAKIIGFVK